MIKRSDLLDISRTFGCWLRKLYKRIQQLCSHVILNIHKLCGRIGINAHVTESAARCALRGELNEHSGYSSPFKIHLNIIVQACAYRFYVGILDYIPYVRKGNEPCFCSASFIMKSRVRKFGVNNMQTFMDILRTCCKFQRIP